MIASNMPDTCTARHFYDFTDDAHWDSSDGEHLQKKIADQLDVSKNQLIVCVFAFLTAQQSRAGAMLKELGFVKTVDYHNYKYPTTSGRLCMYTRDMNDYKRGMYAKQQAAPVVNPLARMPRPSVPLAGIVVVPDIVDSFTTNSGTFRTRGTCTLRGTSFLRAVSNGPRRWITQRGTFVVTRPFPLGQWQAIPENFGPTIPPSLVGSNITLLFPEGQTYGIFANPNTMIANVIAIRRNT